MADADAIVTAFVKEFDAERPNVGALMEYFSDDAVYHNIPFRPAVGKEAIEKVLGGMTDMVSKGWEIRHQVASGDVVLNERVDRFEVSGKSVEIPVVGVFELQDGKITAWRDYFDAAMWQKQLAD